MFILSTQPDIIKEHIYPSTVAGCCCFVSTTQYRTDLALTAKEARYSGPKCTLTHNKTTFLIQYNATRYSFITLAIAGQFFKILSLLDPSVNLLQNLSHIFQHNLNVSPHYLVKRECSNCVVFCCYL